VAPGARLENLRGGRSCGLAGDFRRDGVFFVFITG
jgi:hypothetical protein